MFQGSKIFTKALIKYGIEKLEIVQDKDVDALSKLFPSFDNRILIFDDLERCNCSVNDVLGQVNAFVEHTEARVIIIANEAEIGKWQLNRNPELQMMLAADEHLKIDLEKTELEKIRDQFHRDKQPEWNPDYIERRRAALFHSNEEYLRIKEKVIGQTITYKPDLKRVFSSLICDDRLSPELKKVCNTFIDTLVYFAEKDQYKNIRAFQFFLEKAKAIFDAIENQYESVHNVIILYCYRSCIRYMKTGQTAQWEDLEYGTQAFGNGLSFEDNIIGFRFIDELILKNDLDINMAKTVLSIYTTKAESEGRLSGDPYLLLSDWYCQEEDQVKEWLEKLNNNVVSEKYSTTIFPKILDYVIMFGKMKEYQEISKKIYDSMISYVSKAIPDILQPIESEYMLLEHNDLEQYKIYLEQLNRIIEERKGTSTQDRIDCILEDNENWGELLLESLQEENTRSKWTFIYRSNPQRLLELIKQSKNKQIHYFRKALSKLYSGTLYYENRNDDYDHLLILLQLLNGIDWEHFGAIKQKNVEWLISNLNDYCENIKSATGS